jgi:hypothetical protein
MDLAHPVFQFWRQAKDPANDRLMYEIVAARDVAEAREMLKKRMCWKRVPRGLTVRLSFTTIDCGAFSP